MSWEGRIERPNVDVQTESHEMEQNQKKNPDQTLFL